MQCWVWIFLLLAVKPRQRSGVDGARPCAGSCSGAELIRSMAASDPDPLAVADTDATELGPSATRVST